MIEFSVEYHVHNDRGPGAVLAARGVPEPLGGCEMGKRIYGDDEARIASKMMLPNDEGCILFTGRLNADGYAQLRMAGRTVGLHIHTLERKLGRLLSPGMQAGHLCHDVAAALGKCIGGPTCSHRRCCNPEHLMEQTPRENCLASVNTLAAKNAAKMCCPKCGGDYDHERSSGKRRCRLCALSGRRKNRAVVRARQVHPSA